MKGQIKRMFELEYKVNSNNVNNRRWIYLGVAKLIENILLEMDHDKFKVELVDIWHFLVNYLLMHDNIDNCIKIIYQNMDGYHIDYKLPIKLDTENNQNIDEILFPYEEFMAYALLKTDSKEYKTELVKRFFTCLNSAGMTFQDLYTLYIWKNVLNKFRQDHGYKEGTYKKIWSNWQEDNVTMHYILNQNPDLSYEEIYNELEKEYNK